MGHRLAGHNFPVLGLKTQLKHRLSDWIKSKTQLFSLSLKKSSLNVKYHRLKVKEWRKIRKHKLLKKLEWLSKYQT